MEDRSQDLNSPNESFERNEPVRSRWTPKPEQILILESIFNSGMVNPPKDETVRIRKLLENFGSVGDANVFYWFQNRRSRSRRRQRQIQASLPGEQTTTVIGHGGGGGGGFGFFKSPPSSSSSSSSCSFVGSSSCSSTSTEDLLIYSGNQMGFQEIEQTSIGANSSMAVSSGSANLHYQSGSITVFINGVATEIASGPVDMKAMFGEDLLLLHSSGVPVPFNHYGFSLESLRHGESYFLVSRPT